jgi:glutathione S-transferase
MALTLHRHPLSHDAEKVRAALDFKGLEYRVVDHAPSASDQLAIYRLSGQRGLPVLEHDGQAIHDATAIALHLERAFPAAPGRRALLPDDIPRRRAALDLEGRISASLGVHAPLVVYERSLRDRALFDELAQGALPVRGVTLQATRVIGLASRAAMLLPASRRPFDEAREAVRAMLDELTDRLTRSAFLLGDEALLPDVAAVGLSMLLKFPESRYLARPGLAGRGVPEFVDDPRYRRFFAWRDAFYREFLR